MKRIVLCCLALIGLSFGKSLAQKIDLDRETWAHHYVALPKSKDMASLNTYSITMFANFENINRVGLSPDKIEKTFKLDGFVYTTGAADLVFEVTIEDFKKGPEEVKAQESTVYDGAKNVTKKTYIPVTSYTIPTTLKITKTSDKEVILNIIIGGIQNPVFIGSGEYPTAEAASAQFKGTEEKRMEAFKEKYYNMLTAEIKSFKEKYDFSITEDTDIFWHVDLKKAPEFAEFNGKLTAAKEIFAGIKATDDIKIAREKLAPTMLYFRENADKLTGEDKKNRKLKYAYLLNLGKTQLWLEMLDECAITAQQVIDNDYDKSDGKALLRNVNLLKEELSNSPNGSRHLVREGFTSNAHFTAAEIKSLQVKNAPSVVAKPTTTTTTVEPKKDVEVTPPPFIPMVFPKPPATMSEEDFKRDLDMALTFKFVEGIITGDGFLLPGEYIYEDKKLIGQKMIQNSFMEGGKVSNETSVYLSYNFNDNSLTSMLMRSACENYHSSLLKFDITYNEQKRISKIGAEWFRKGSAKERKFTRTSYELSYEGNRIVKVIKNSVLGEGDWKNLTVIQETQERIATLDWKSDNELTITTFETKHKPKVPDVVVSTGKHTHKLAKGSYSYLFEGDNNYRTSKEVKLSGNQMMEVYTSPFSKSETVSTLGDKGEVLKVVYNETKDNQIQGKKETNVTYTLKQSNFPPDDICNYNSKSITSFYDTSGKLIRESTGGQFRDRNADGTWGPWRSFTY